MTDEYQKLDILQSANGRMNLKRHMFDLTKICGSKSNGTGKLKNFGCLEEVLFAGYLKISFSPKVPEDILCKTEEAKEVNKTKKKLEQKTDP